MLDVLPKIGDIKIFPDVWVQMVANQHVSENLTSVNNQKEWEPFGTGSIFPMQRYAFFPKITNINE